MNQDFDARFATRRVLGEGAMGLVLLALDRKTDREVAVKVLAPAHAASAEARWRFREEFLTMRRLQHPALVRAFEFGELADGTLFFTMEPLSGTTLAERKELSAEAAQAYLIEALYALAFLHAHSRIHLDLKPENLHVGPEGLKLLDLGLIGRVGEASQGPRGTLRYVAPEVIRGERLDGRADLYSLGAVFYHLLAGVPPFEAESPLDLLRAHRNHVPIPLSDRRPELPEDLARQVMALLTKLPLERPQSAAELLARMGLEAPRTLLHPGLIGRDHEVDGILEKIERPEPLPLCVTIRGPRGVGKSLLIEELRLRMQLCGGEAILLTGGSGGPYDSLLPLKRWFAAQSPMEWQACLAVLEGEVEGLAPHSTRLRMQAAWERLFRAIGEPAVLLVDDWETLDEASRGVLSGLASRKGLPLRLIAAGAPFGIAHDLRPFTEGQTRELLARMLGTSELHPGFLSRIHRMARGLPANLREIVTELVRRGALGGAGRWRTEHVALEEIELTGASAAVLGTLSEAGMHLTSVLALFRGAGPLSILAASSGLDEAALAEALTELRALGIVVVEDEGVRLQSPGLAAAIRATLDQADETTIHEAIARSYAPLENRDYEQAYHWHKAADPQQAAPFALAAAQQFLAAYCLAEVETLLDWAMEAPKLDPRLRLQALEIRGDSCRYRAKLDQARQAYREAIELRDSLGMGSAHLWVNLSLIEQVRSNFAEAQDLAERGLQAAKTEGAPVQEARALTTLARILHLMGAPALETTHHALEASRRAQVPAFEAEALALLGYLGLGDPEQLPEALDRLHEALVLRQGLADPVGLSDAHMFIGNAQQALGHCREARTSFERNLALCREIGAARDDEATALANLAHVRGELGEFHAALQEIEEALALASLSGNVFLEAYALALRGGLRAEVGRLGEAGQDIQRAVELANGLSNPYLESMIAIPRSRILVLRGDPASAIAAAHEGLVRARDRALAELEPALLGALAEGYGRLGAVGHARTYAQEAERLAGKRQAHGMQARMAATLARFSEADPSALIAQARELGRAAGMEPLEVELDLLEGRRLRQEGRGSAAARLLRHAHEKALRLGMPLLAFETAKDLYAAEGIPEHAHLLRAAEVPVRAIGLALDPVAREAFEAQWWPREMAGSGSSEAHRDMIDEMGAVVADFGRLVAGTLSYAEVLDRIIDRVMEITEAERSMILLVDDGGSLSGLVSRPLGESPGMMAFSRSFVETALSERRSIWVEDAQADDRFSSAQSVMALDLRTVICVPLIVDDAPLGLLYLDRNSIHRTFRAADLKLVEGLAGFAGLAIANARRHTDAQRRSEILAASQEIALLTLETDRRVLAGGVMEQAIRISKADHAVLWLREPGREAIATAEPRCFDARIIAEVEQTAQPQIRLGVPGPQGSESVMAVPLLVGRRMIAVLYVGAQQRSFSPDDLATLEAIAVQAAHALAGREIRAAQAERLARFERALALVDDRQHAANLDPVSGTFGPAYFLRKLGEAVAEARVEGGSLSLLVYAPEGLGELAARHGQEAADSVLCQVAAELRSMGGRTDVLGRLPEGGFGILMPEAIRIAPEQVAARMERLSLCDAAGREVWNLKGRVSVAQWAPNLEPEELLLLALGK